MGKATARFAIFMCALLVVSFRGKAAGLHTEDMQTRFQHWVERIHHGDYGMIDEAASMLQKLDPNGVHWEMHDVINALLDAKQNEAAERLAMLALLSAPMDTNSVYYYQRIRLHAFLAEGKYDQALACAKGLYNVAPLGYYSENAVREVEETLRVTRRDHPEDVQRFRMEQLKAASVNRNGKGKIRRDRSTVLGSIEVDAKPFLRDLQEFLWWKTSPGRQAAGNLYLLADLPEKAHSVFQEDLLQASDPEDKMLVESVARSLRAEAGGIGPANAFVGVKPSH